MHAVDEKWMAYIDREVRRACDEKGWGCRIRRKWSVREKPVSDSAIEDYEWKLFPPEHSATFTAGHASDEGIYYVLRFDRRDAKFVLQHDTAHCGDWGPNFDLYTYTEIHLAGVYARRQLHAAQGIEDEGLLTEPAPDGWLSDHLVDLTSRFQPNRFSIT